MDIIKNSGKRVKFNPIKVKQTCLRAGASQILSDEIVEEVSRRVYSGMKTYDILKLIINLLNRKNPAVAARYSLKKAMMDLGPAGFIFEEFIKRLLKSYHCQAYFPPLIQGGCVKHEVDIIAKLPKEDNQLTRIPLSQGKLYMIECKYHNTPGLRSNLKETLYVWARFLDLKEVYKFNYQEKINYPWLISNTKFSIEAIKYANCKNMRLLGWKYPRGASLENLIESQKFYPITILKSLDQNTKGILFTKNIILVRDLISNSAKTLEKRLGLTGGKLEKLISEAKLIINS